jgi:hypothetical protein
MYTALGHCYFLSDAQTEPEPRFGHHLQSLDRAYVSDIFSGDELECAATPLDFCSLGKCLHSVSSIVCVATISQ